jgi:hypothetical protein
MERGMAVMNGRRGRRYRVGVIMVCVMRLCCVVMIIS